MIRIIRANPGKGKTSLMTNLAIEQMQGANARQALKTASKTINNYIEGGYNELTLPTNHMVYADYPIIIKKGKVRNKYCNGFHIGLPNDKHEVMFLPPNSHIFLDEAQKYFNSREKGLADYISRFYELHRHHGLTITLCVQRLKLIDKNIRELAEEVIDIVDLKHEYEHGLLVRSKWECNVYDSSEKLIQNIESGKNEIAGTKQNFIYEGNVFRHYNSKFFAPLFMKGREKQDFANEISENYSACIDDIREFNAKYGYEVPSTYYKSKR